MPPLLATSRSASASLTSKPSRPSCRHSPLFPAAVQCHGRLFTLAVAALDWVGVGAPVFSKSRFSRHLRTFKLKRAPCGCPAGPAPTYPHGLGAGSTRARVPLSPPIRMPAVRRNGRTALMRAASKDLDVIVRALVGACADMNTKASKSGCAGALGVLISTPVSTLRSLHFQTADAKRHPLEYSEYPCECTSSACACACRGARAWARAL
jgi:hypothetical protein